MNVLVVGGFSLIGQKVLDELIVNKHKVMVLETEDRCRKRIGHQYRKNLKGIIWGHELGLGDPLDDIDVVVYMAAISTVFCRKCDDSTDVEKIASAFELLRMIEGQSNPPKMLFIGSENSSEFLTVCENRLRASSIDWVILELGTVLCDDINLNKAMVKTCYHRPLSFKEEVITVDDVATAINNAAELLVNEGVIDKKTFYIGGGEKQGCKMTHGVLLEQLLDVYNLSLPDSKLFNKEASESDWKEHAESQYYLDYQNHGFKDYLINLRQQKRGKKRFIRVLKFFIQNYIEHLSPYK